MSAPERQISGSAWRLALERALEPPCAMVAVGNRLQGDDAVGPEIVDRIQEQGAFPCFDGGLAPENLLAPICRLAPRTVLLIDAVEFGAPPGGIRLFTAEELAEIDISTHAISPRLLGAYLQERTGAVVWLLGIQPQQRGLGQGMSRPCREAVEAVARALAAA